MRPASPGDLGFDAERLKRVSAAIDADIARESYDGAVALVARRGAIALHEAFGFANRDAARPAHCDDVFCLFSITKTLTAVTVLARIERGELALTTPVADVIPEFGNRGKQRITIFHLLTHTSGLTAAMPPVPPELMGNLDATIAAICEQGLDARPGTVCNYSALSAHALLAEVVRRLDGRERRFRDILADEVLRPLNMSDTWLGVRTDLAARRVPIVLRDRSPGLFPAEALEGFNDLIEHDAEVPGGGALSTAADLARFAEMLRRGGELDGARILAPATVRLATTNHTGLRPNLLWSYAREMRPGWDDFPAYIGLTFWLRGEGVFPTPFGSLASPGTFGHCGASTTAYWVDPARELVFVLLTAGGLEETRSMERFQRLSDLVHTAVVD
ncbi:MAG: beta-lactamase family protein [Deltaproteobacteria bacterium]|nr:MAG: beta-lactamase family protein [Deltaproteobacteria bacterium]